MTIDFYYFYCSLNFQSRISNGNAKNKAIWIDGGIHAREWISPASVTYIINDLVENWDEQPQHIRNINWYILPVHNPDGYEYVSIKIYKKSFISHLITELLKFFRLTRHIVRIDCGGKIVRARVDVQVSI